MQRQEHIQHTSVNKLPRVWHVSASNWTWQFRWHHPYAGNWRLPTCAVALAPPAPAPLPPPPRRPAARLLTKHVQKQHRKATKSNMTRAQQAGTPEHCTKLTSKQNQLNFFRGQCASRLAQVLTTLQTEQSCDCTGKSMQAEIIDIVKPAWQYSFIGAWKIWFSKGCQDARALGNPSAWRIEWKIRRSPINEYQRKRPDQIDPWRIRKQLWEIKTWCWTRGKIKSIRTKGRVATAAGL